MEISDSNEKILKKFGIKPCRVKLDKFFSVIRIKCSAESSEENENLTCDEKQTNSHTFCVQIKRKMIENSSAKSSIPRKRVKFNETKIFHRIDESNLPAESSKRSCNNS